MYSKTTKNILIYLIISGLLVIFSFISAAPEWQSSSEFHTIMEVIATIIALTIGLLALVRYYSQRSILFLIIGASFVGTGFLDGYHAIVTSEYFKPFMPSDNTSLIPLSWVASRQFLGIGLIASWAVWHWESNGKSTLRISSKRVYVITALYTLASFLFFAFVALPVAYYPDFFIHRPADLIPGALFCIALFGYFKKSYWWRNHFDHWIVIALILSVLSQALFMSLSNRLFDFNFDAAHTLKIVSYICVLTGLLINMYTVYCSTEQANRAKTAFLANMSHELRTPLNAVIGYSETLQMDIFGDLNNKQRDYVNHIHESGQLLLNLINDILQLSNVESYEILIKTEKVYLKNIMPTVRSLTDNLFLKSNGELIVSQEVETCKPILVESLRVQQILINLISNAVKYGQKNPKVWIDVSHKDNGLLHIYIKDNGLGIAKEHYENVFKPFNRCGKENSGIDGTGTGLSIVKSLTLAMNGSVGFKSTPGEGSTFWIALPLA